MEKRRFRRFQGNIPARLHLEEEREDAVVYEGRLKDLSVAALCLVVPHRSTPAIRRGTRARISLVRKGGTPDLNLTGTALYSLVLPSGDRHCVFLFDGIYEEIAACIAACERLDVWVRASV